MKRKTKRSAFLAVLALTCAFTGLAFGGCGGSQEPVRSIQSVEKTATNGLVDTYTILFTDGTTSTFELTNGEDGDAGVGIANVEINYKGEVVVELENGKKYTVTVTSPSCNFVPVVTSPTCGEQGYTTYTCTDCGFSYINNYVAPTGHHYIDKYCTFCKEEQPFGTIAYETDWYDSSQSTFELSTKEQLAGLAYLVNNGNDFSGKTIKLPNDVDLASQSWVPIGTSSNAFKGTFDGQNFKIKNLCIDADYSYVGFFGYATGAIKRVEIAGANISVSGENSYVGALCGYASSSISEVKVSGYVNAPDCNYVGGILGGISTGAIDLTYTDLSNSANVNGNNYVGGLIGELYNSYDAYSSKSVAFKASNNSGKVEGNDYVGGLYGRVYVNNTRDNYSISFSSFDNKNTGNVTGAYYVGGIFGYVYAENESTLKNSQSSAEITGTAYVGGLIGYSERVSVDSCVNTGSKVVANGYEIADGGDYRTYLGGFVGRGYGASNCVNEVELVYDLDGRYIGGIAGFTTNSVTDCSNTANVKAENSSYVGGIVGGISTGAIDLTYTDLSNSANISGNDYVGGLIGELYNSYDAYSNRNVALTLSNNVGKVEGNDYVGGLYGRVYVNNTKGDYSISFSSFDNKNTGNVTGAYYVGGIFGYVYAENESTLKNSQSSAEITGTAYVGGLIGYSERVSVDSCVNTGSKVVANGYEIADGGDYRTYLGGFVGRGYGASNCVNEVELVYDLDGRYIGGIAGLATNSVTDCSNTTNVKAENSCNVGGLVGCISAGAINITCTNLSNSGDIKGEDYVGGLIGEIISSYDAWSSRTLTLTLSNNSGKVEGNNYVAGLYGYVYANNSKGDYGISLVTFDNTNTGDVTGIEYVGGIAGYICVEWGYTVETTRFSNTGTITAGAEAVYYGELFGENKSITLT